MYEEIIDNPEFIKLKSTDFYTVKCKVCNKEYQKDKKHITYVIKHNLNSFFCSSTCQYIYKGKTFYSNCSNCGINIKKTKAACAKSKNYFCSRSCAATFNNKNKKFGTKRSKLELWIENKLNSLYPNIQILYCNKEIIKSELDIYIPELKLAFELNGIFHYEPIYGTEKLSQIVNNDNNKFQSCLKQNIELCIIDTSHLKYFKEHNCYKYLDIITNIINNKLNLVT